MKKADQLGTSEIEHRQSGHSKCHQLAADPGASGQRETCIISKSKLISPKSHL
jgi:hypothetical protein